MDAITSVVGRIVGSCLDPATTWIKKELSYIRHYKDNMEILRKQHDELETLKLQIEGEVEAGERKREMIGPLVDDWLQDVKVFLANDKWSAFIDENKIKKKDKCCFGLLHCNLKYRYLTSKRATEMLESTKEKIKKMEDRSSRAITLPGEPPELGSMPTAHSKSLASRESTIIEIMEALKDNEVHMIGIYGMGGVGKTTLIEEVARRAEANESFKVVIAEVSQTPNVLKMQQQIAERIGLSLQGLKSEGERAREVHKALKRLNRKEEDDQMSKKRTRQVVVILDNMWKKLDLYGVGIPNECKIALTTRSELLCREMGANKKFEVRGLNDKEATELLLERAGRLPNHDDGYKFITEELVKKCGGLPLAIDTLANSLRDHDLLVWQRVAAQLERSVSTRVGGAMEENVYPILEWSYNFISSKEKKKFFLLCCLFPLGLSIAIQDLMRYGAGLGLFHYVNSLDEAIEQAYSWAVELKSSSLLLEDEDEQHVKIHDVVRSFSLSTANKGENIFHVGSFPRWLTKESLKTYTAISMTSDDYHEPLSQFKFSKLEILLLKGSQPSEFRNNFFKWMKSLKVLVISDMKSLKLPPSITQLKNLRTLHLEHCELSDISKIASLVNLLFLSLRGSLIEKLPKNFKNLVHLKVLDLTECSKLQNIPADVIARLKKLEGLYMAHSFETWALDNSNRYSDNEGQDDEGEETSLIDHQRHSNNFVPSEMAGLIESDSLFYMAHSFETSALDNSNWYSDNEGQDDEGEETSLIDHQRHSNNFVPSEMAGLIELDSLFYLAVLEIHVPDIDCLPVNLLFRHLLHFQISIGGKSINNFFSQPGDDFIQTSQWKSYSQILLLENIYARMLLSKQTINCLLKKTKCLILKEIKGLTNVSSINDGFKDLKSLHVTSCHGIDYIAGTSKLNEMGAFSILEEFYARQMPELKGMYYGPDLYASFYHLKKLYLYDIKSIRSFWDNGDMQDRQPFFNEKMKFPNLEELSITNAPSIVELWHLEDVEEEVAAFPILVSLKLDELPELKSIWRSKDNIIHRSFRNLKNLKVENCDSLKILCPFSIATALEQLDALLVDNNENMKEIIAKETGDMKNNDTEMIIFPKLRNILLRNLPSLKCFFGGIIKLVFPSLESIECYTLEEMVTFISSEYPGDSNALFNDKVVLPAIKNIDIYDVSELQEIWGSHLDAKSFNKLERLHISFAEKATKAFSLDAIKQMRNLKEIYLRQLRSAKEFIEWVGFCNDDVENSGLFHQLRELTIDSFPLLKRIQWKELAVQNLCNLRISMIHGLTSLFSASICRRFVNLEDIKIDHCNGIEQVLAQGSIEDTSNNATPTTAVLPRVKTIWFCRLPRLRSFSSENYITLEFPSLEEVEIWECPMMETFSYGSLSTPRLCKIKIGWKNEKKCFDLNAVIKKRILEKPMSEDTAWWEDSGSED